VKGSCRDRISDAIPSVASGYGENREKYQVSLLRDEVWSWDLPTTKHEWWSLDCDNIRMKMKTLEWLEVVAWDKARGIFVSWISVELCKFGKIIWWSFQERGLNVINLSQTAAWGALSSKSKIEERLSFCLKTEENQEHLCRYGRSQDLPSAYSLLASSPENRTSEGLI
jgi:hypothetical protein